jgi:hypothetical protein
VQADLVAMELDLTETNVWLMDPFMRAQRYREANQLLEEINKLWQRQHLEDTRFAKSNHTRFVHFLTRCGVLTVRLERSGVKSKASGIAPSLLFDFAADTATIRANG